jgi:hypothetical protein
MPKGNTRCSCRNVVIDVDYGRIAIEDHTKIKLFKLVHN